MRVSGVKRACAAHPPAGWSWHIQEVMAAGFSRAKTAPAQRSAFQIPGGKSHFILWELPYPALFCQGLRVSHSVQRDPWLTLSHSLSAGAILSPGIPSLEPPPLRKLQGAHCCELSRVTLTPGAGSGAGLGGRPGVASSSAGDTVRVAPASLLAWFTSTYVTNTQHAFIIFAVTIFWRK